MFLQGSGHRIHGMLLEGHISAVESNLHSNTTTDSMGKKSILVSYFHHSNNMGWSPNPPQCQDVVKNNASQFSLGSRNCRDLHVKVWGLKESKREPRINMRKNRRVTHGYPLINQSWQQLVPIFSKEDSYRMVPYLYLTDQEPFRFFFCGPSLSLSLFRTVGFSEQLETEGFWDLYDAGSLISMSIELRLSPKLCNDAGNVYKKPFHSLMNI